MAFLVTTSAFAQGSSKGVTDKVPPIEPALLNSIMDGKPISAGTPEIEAYNEFLVLASRSSDKAFRAAARRDVRATKGAEALERTEGRGSDEQGRHRSVR